MKRMIDALTCFSHTSDVKNYFFYGYDIVRMKGSHVHAHTKVQVNAKRPFLRFNERETARNEAKIDRTFPIIISFHILQFSYTKYKTSEQIPYNIVESFVGFVLSSQCVGFYTHVTQEPTRCELYLSSSYEVTAKNLIYIKKIYNSKLIIIFVFFAVVVQFYYYFIYYLFISQT